MAVEARRGCGYRKVGGLYLVGPGGGCECDRLPFPVKTCPCCGQGIKQARGWTWIDLPLLTGGNHAACRDTFACPLCMAVEQIGRAGLVWIGARFYPTPGDFAAEVAEMGISRRIAAVPRGFKLGETWVLLAHPRGMTCPQCLGGGLAKGDQGHLPCEHCENSGKLPAIFRVFQPTAIEKILTESQAKDAAAVEELRKQGITPVIVPDNDRDHQGTVYDDPNEDEPPPMFDPAVDAEH